MIPTDIEELLQEHRITGPELANARAYRTYIEEWKRSKVAILMQEASVRGVKTAAAQEREALSSPEYLEILTALQSAVEAEERLRYKMRQIEMSVDVWRTLRADERIERKGYGA